MPEFRTVRGMRDFLPEEAKMMKHIEERARSVAQSFGYREIVTPLVESYELLATKAGEEVRLRMFAFKDMGGRMVALRPEFTPSVARLVATSLRNEPRPLRLFCLGSLYRYDEPQKGRYREFWQSDYELIGSGRPEADAEIILLTQSLLNSLRLRNFSFKVGHVGILRGVLSGEGLDEKVQNSVFQLMDKKHYEDAFRVVRDCRASEKCLTVLRNLVEISGGEVFEAVDKIEACVKGYKDALVATENLGQILSLVAESGCSVDMRVEAGFARGLEYYTGMIFEAYVPELDVSLTGGGRYDKLVELFGGDPTPAVGVAPGLNTIMLAVRDQKVELEEAKEKRIVVVPVGDENRPVALQVSSMLRSAGMTVEFEVMGRRINKALEDANRRRMDYAVIVGKKELEHGEVILKDLERRKQVSVKVEKLAETVASCQRRE
jgi:histidyl-tRNA synthetase